MAVNPSLTASGQQGIPLVPSPFELQTVDRDILPSTVAPIDSRQFCVPSQFGYSVLPNANMQNMLSNRAFSGWGILPYAESIRAVTRRNEIIQSHNPARTEMDINAIYQQRRMEKANPTVGLGIPFLFGSSIPASPAAHHGRSLVPASDQNFHRSTMRNLQGKPMLVAIGPYFPDSWGQKCCLRRGMRNWKVHGSDTYSSKSHAEVKFLDQTHANPYEEDEYAKDPEREAFNNQKPRETNGKPTAAPTSTCGEPAPTGRHSWAAHGASLEPEAWDGGEEKASFAACSEKNGICPPGLPTALSGTRDLVTIGEQLSLAKDIQKWTVDDVHDFISGLPGCSGYAQVFKDHAIDGEILPLLTEDHLRDIMGLKLGPALKIQSQVSRQGGSMLHKKSLLLPTHIYSTRQEFDLLADTSPFLDFNSWGDTLGIPCSQDIIIPKGIGKIVQEILNSQGARTALISFPKSRGYSKRCVRVSQDQIEGMWERKPSWNCLGGDPAQEASCQSGNDLSTKQVEAYSWKQMLKEGEDLQTSRKLQLPL
ncbi:sterile alpha motif domain-containing protein 7 [Dasypus novemcinctus]|uniref:sterile alpha motif domain-containing protein 7 n=1 Tax=Dasypus novemcinctus TaxID=9361 RepID=UPI00265D9B4A|nr:sterile alpha motif domain-containing protein 7 [Dasypus novemcinctus]